MTRTTSQLREDARAIWQAGLAAVRSEALIHDNIHVDGHTLRVGEEEVDLNLVERILVVGAGKAGAGMAAGLEEALGPEWMRKKQLTGWVNVPADCLRPLQRIHLHPARPAGQNEPTEEGVRGGREILNIVRAAGDRDVCFCLLSGGGSALLPAPIDGISLADKQAVTRHLSAAGANIQELNTVRKHLSLIKGGGLAAACRAGQLISLIISDVLGDPLDVIASGPTAPDESSPEEALRILRQFKAAQAGISAGVFAALEQAAARPLASDEHGHCRVTNLVLGNNAVAVDAAGQEAERRGYAHAMHAATQLEGDAEDIGRHLADMALRMRREAGPDCLITGGEPVVQLVEPSQRGLGGRNQQLVLAALVHLLQQNDDALRGIVLLSGGTDGEDGPTDAAGAWIDADVVRRMKTQGLAAEDFLRRNDAYHFFEPLDALMKTGPTHTNVCDVRVVVVDRPAGS